MFANVNISDGGYRSNEGHKSLIHDFLFPAKGAKKGKGKSEEATQPV